MKRLKIFVCVNIVLAVVFTILTVSFHRDVSLAAFPLSLAYTLVVAFVTLRRLIQNHDGRALLPVQRLFQYEPFVFIAAFILQRAGEREMPYALDAVAAMVWVLITVTSFVILSCLGEKRLADIDTEWATVVKNAQQKPPFIGSPVRVKAARVGIELLEWVDALVQAVFAIVLLNIFLFQLYAIPSESMVPTFLVKDRVAVFKTLAGPKFPLSSFGLPYVQKYKRGDVVVFRNPHYKDDRKSEVKTFMSQLVYMVSLTLLKTNTDENGDLKYDPLVKRVKGLPGEQLMLMDGTLYVRTQEEPTFHSVDDTSALWDFASHTELYDVEKNVLKVERLPMSSVNKANIINVGKNKMLWYYPLDAAIRREGQDFVDTATIEQERRKLNLQAAADECRELSHRFASLVAQRGMTETVPDDEVRSFFSADRLFAYHFFEGMDNNTIKLLTVAGGEQWMESFLTSWYAALGDLSAYSETQGQIVGPQLVGGDLYTDSCFRLNVMAKLAAGRVIVRTAELIADNVAVSEWVDDEERREQLAVFLRLCAYINHLDQRNMPLFPANDAQGNAQYIPEHCYFMMGDNRYNSADMRHATEFELVPLTAYDAYSFTYYSNIAPQYVARNRILGKASLRFWPWYRFAFIK